MISSLNRVLAVSGLVCVLGGLAGPALCADSPALPTGAGTSAPGNAPAAAQPPEPTELGGPGSINPFTPVTSQTLGKVESSLVGVIDSQSGGFKGNMWAGTDRLIVEVALPHLPTATTSPAAMSLVRRLLLTRAQSPSGATHGASLIGERLDLVLAIGQVGIVDTMVGQTGDQSSTPQVSAAAVDALLYEGKDKEACALAEKQRGIAKSIAWTKRLTFCSALAGKTAEARLGVDLLGDAGDNDPGFASLMSKWLDKAKLTSVKIAVPDAVHFALLRNTHVAIDTRSLAATGPAFLTAWANYDKAPMAQRLIAAERATSSGAMPQTVLLKLYQDVKLSHKLLAKKFDPKIMPSGTEGLAYAVQKYDALTDNDERGHMIAAALEGAKTRGALAAAAILLRKGIAATTADPGLIDVAPTLATGAVMAGDAAHAKRWLDLMKAQGQGDSESAHALQSLLAVATGDAAFQWTADQFVARLKAASGDDRARAVLEWTLMRALGTPASEPVVLAELGAPATYHGTAPMPSIIDALRNAATHDRFAETVMFALMALGSDGPRGAQPFALQLAVNALAHVGLMSDARAIAAEALAWQMP